MALDFAGPATITPSEERAFAYSNEIAKVVTDQLVRFATLNPHQLAGHVANLDFWTAEVRHALDVIDGYRPRFDRLKAGQLAHVERYGTIAFDPRRPDDSDRPLPKPRRVPHHELKLARIALCDAFYAFLARCYRAGVLDEATARAACASLEISIDPNDFRPSARA
jgi:hypothetical protein